MSERVGVLESPKRNDRMALPQRDNLIPEIQKTDLLLEYAVQHGEVEEAERLREKLRKLASMGDEEGRIEP